MNILSCQLHKQESFSLDLIVFPACQEINCQLRVDPVSSYLGFCLIRKLEYLRKDHAAWYMGESIPSSWHAEVSSRRFQDECQHE